MIKKHWNKNEYYYAGNNLWVRDFAKKLVQPIDINHLIGEQDMNLMLHNETENHAKMYQRIDTESINHQCIVIVSDGYKFDEKHKLLESLPDNVFIIGVNDVLRRWRIRKIMHYYVTNNPYEESINLLPAKAVVFPKLIASIRTYPQFIESMQTLTYVYTPTPDHYYAGSKSEVDYTIDDYRNSICASLGLCYRFEAKKVLLLCCDDVYEEERPGADRLDNGLWMYPQQKLAHNLIDANLYWLKSSGINIAHHCSGPKYDNAIYVSESCLAEFFAR